MNLIRVPLHGRDNDAS